MNIPKNCNYWMFGNTTINCRLSGHICLRECDVEKIDPTGMFRKRIDEFREIPYLERPRGIYPVELLAKLGGS